MCYIYGAGTAYPSGSICLRPQFLGARSSVFCVVFCRSLFCLFLFGHCIVCPFTASENSFDIFKLFFHPSQCRLLTVCKSGLIINIEEILLDWTVNHSPVNNNVFETSQEVTYKFPTKTLSYTSSTSFFKVCWSWRNFRTL